MSTQNLAGGISRLVAAAQTRASISAITLAALSGLLVGCVSADEDQETSESTQSNFLGIDGVTAEYKAAAAALPLPPGDYSYKIGNPYPGAEPGDTYQTGSGDTAALSDWNCSWGWEYLARVQRGEESAAEALSIFSSILDQPAFATSFDPDSFIPYYTQMIEAAQVGDPSLIRDQQETNCPDPGSAK